MWPRSGNYWRSFKVGIVPWHVRRLLVPQPAQRPRGHDDLIGSAAAERPAAENLPLQGQGRPQQSEGRGQGGRGPVAAQSKTEIELTPTPALPGEGSPQNLSGGGNPQNPSGAKPAQTKAKKSKPAAPAETSKHELSELDALRYALLRRLETVAGFWRECPSRLCRRQHACVSAGHECAKLPQPPRDPEGEAAAIASFAAALKRRAAELAASGGADRNDDKS